MSPHHQGKAIVLIWCIIIPSMFATFAGNSTGWLRLLPALILLIAGVLATAILYPKAQPSTKIPESDELWTPRELEVLALIAQGCTNEEIAACLVVALSTVKTHINNIYRKLGVRNRVQAVTYAHARGLV
jgi:DNA-binding NarL/FixJ family response regulator